MKLGMRGGVVPTLNLGDNTGDTRATVLILIEEGNPVIMRNREGCAGGGKGPMYSERSFTLATSNDQIVFYGNRVDDIRIQGDVINTLQARMGTGGGNMPIVAYPIDDGREVEKHQNGTGIGEADAPAYTLDTRQHASIAIAFDTQFGSNANTFEDQSPTLKASQQPPSVTGSTVRRLTPMECERLQGFPDGWTDGQADSHRYKQMGNAVAVPVVEWIVKRLLHPSL